MPNASTAKSAPKRRGRPRKTAPTPAKSPSRPAPRKQDKDLLFILDIGTRSVIGVAGRVVDGLLQVLCVEQLEHSERAVVDGQIEDIEQTARIAGIVKQRMEKQLGLTLRQVHVAAAGRVLKTEHIFCEMEMDEQQSIGPKELAALESGAVKAAYQKLAEALGEEEATTFSCVGHTVVGYQLDGYSFSTLSGHKGHMAGIDLIATFLPSEVVESLYTTMSMLGLTIASMTLEPIAAMNAVVPKELRLLNIALVDVGAGTSDIAVADKGSICGYTMATVAGDEVTERLMQEFLVDFSMAEQMKFSAAAGVETIEYADVLGFPYTVGLPELLERIRPTVQELAQKIADGILGINGGAPKAVFMVGGGSRTPGLCARVAEALGVEASKVAVGGNNYMKRQIVADPQYLSAEYATPIGIAVTAMSAGGGDGFAVTLNGSRVQLLGRNMTVMEALRRGGYQYSQIMGTSGKSVVYEYNGERRIARGGLPTLSEVRVNGALAGLSTVLNAGDEIEFVPAVDGEDAAPTVGQAVGAWQTVPLTLFGRPAAAGTMAMLGGQPVPAGQRLFTGDKLTVLQISTIGELLGVNGFAGPVQQTSINGAPATDPAQPLNAGDIITLHGSGQTPPVRVTVPRAAEGVKTAAQTAVPAQNSAANAPGNVTPAQNGVAGVAAENAAAGQNSTSAQTIAAPAAAPAQAPVATAQNNVTVTPAQNVAPVQSNITAPAQNTASTRNPAPAQDAPARQTLRVTVNGVQRLLPKREDGGYQFFDLLNFVDMGDDQPKGAVILRRNGMAASYLDAIQDNDQVEITWDK